MGAKCGTLREACLSDTDIRYSSNADYDAIAQNDIWERTTGYAKLVGMAYTGEGNVIKEINTTFDGLNFSYSMENLTEYRNYTVSGTRALFEYKFFAKSAPNSILGPFGLAIRNLYYATSTFELDGSLHTMPGQRFTFNGTGPWQEGPTTLSRVIDAKTIFATGSGVTNAQTCIDPACKKTTVVEQFFEDGVLEMFLVYQGEKITADEYTTGIQNTIIDYNILPQFIAPLNQEIGQNYPTEEKWCETDPACSESPYQEPKAPLRTGATVGFVILGLAILCAVFYVFHSTTMKRKEKRIKEQFSMRMKQSITMKSFSGNNSAQFHEIFKRIDKDGDGYIERDELQEYMNAKGETMPESDFDALWKSFDIDKSGTIDYLEFCVFMAKNQEVL